MSQPCNLDCNVSQPGKIDEELDEFWVGNPWQIFEKHNLSAFERNRLYLNVGGRSFVDVSYVSGADHDGDARGAIAADFNHDGQLDLAVRHAGGAPLVLYQNEFEPRNYLLVTLRGTRSNRLGVGARCVAVVGDRQIVRERFPVNSHLCQNPLVLHFGLNQETKVDRLVIRWPSGVEQELDNLPANCHLVVTEGNTEYETVEAGEAIAP